MPIEHLVACALIRDGVQYSFGFREHWRIRAAINDIDPYKPNPIDEMGFLTNTGRFVSRSEARIRRQPLAARMWIAGTCRRLRRRAGRSGAPVNANSGAVCEQGTPHQPGHPHAPLRRARELRHGDVAQVSAQPIGKQINMCGTTACIAGHAYALFKPEIQCRKIGSMDLVRDVRLLLDLTSEQAMDLFWRTRLGRRPPTSSNTWPIPARSTGRKPTSSSALSNPLHLLPKVKSS